MARAGERGPPASTAAHYLRRTDGHIPPLPFADNFLGGSLLTLLIRAVLVAAALIGLGSGVGAQLLGKSSSSSAAVRAPRGLLGQATWPTGARQAPEISSLVDQHGDRFSLASLHGRTVVVEFFDYRCKQECPLAGRALAAAEGMLPRVQRPVLVVVSVNPLDTPASTRAAARAWGLAGLAPWHWLRGTHGLLAPVWRSYHIFVSPSKGDIIHTEALI